MGSVTTKADAYNIVVSSTNTGLLNIEQTEEVAVKVSELLQRDLKVRLTSIEPFRSR